MTDVGAGEGAGTTNRGGATSTTAGSTMSRGAGRSSVSARLGAFAGVALASVLRPGSAFGLAAGTFATAGPRWGSAGDADGVGCGLTCGSAGVTRAGTSTTRMSGTSTRRSRQGKARPGSPSPWPPRVRLNSTEWISSDSSSPRAMGLSSRLTRWLSHCKAAVARSDRGVGSDGGIGAALERWRGAGSSVGQCACGAGGPAGTSCATSETCVIRMRAMASILTRRSGPLTSDESGTP